MTNFSFIIPHKNCPDLLMRCLNSIPKRDDIQIIVIDDNSDIDKKPNMGNINAEVVLLNKEESNGAGHARNVGIERATGKWLIFADSDDMFTEFLDSFLDKYTDDEESDIVYLNADNIDEEGNRWPFIIDHYIANYQKKKFYSEKVLRYGIWTPWSRMVKRELVSINNLRFEEIPTGNDMMFSLNCSKYANKIAAESMVLYLYFVPQNRSLTEFNRRKISNISYRIELGQRQNRLYKSVGYLFWDTNIAMFRRPPLGIDKVSYQKEYKKELKRHKVGLCGELYHSIVNRIGVMLGIIKM